MKKLKNVIFSLLISLSLSCPHSMQGWDARDLTFASFLLSAGLSALYSSTHRFDHNIAQAQLFTAFKDGVVFCIVGAMQENDSTSRHHHNLESQIHKMSVNHRQALRILDAQYKNKSELQENLCALISTSSPISSTANAYNGYLKNLNADQQKLSALMIKAQQENVDVNLESAQMLSDEITEISTTIVSSPQYQRAREDELKKQMEYRQARNRIMLGAAGVAAVIGIGAFGYNHYYTSELAKEKVLRSGAEQLAARHQSTIAQQKATISELRKDAPPAYQGR